MNIDEKITEELNKFLSEQIDNVSVISRFGGQSVEAFAGKMSEGEWKEVARDAIKFLRQKDFGSYHIYYVSNNKFYLSLDDEESDLEPSNEDYVISSLRGSQVSVSSYGVKSLGKFDNEEKAMFFIRSRMEEESFWPNVWKLSDHGNFILCEQ